MYHHKSAEIMHTTSPGAGLNATSFLRYRTAVVITLAQQTEIQSIGEMKEQNLRKRKKKKNIKLSFVHTLAVEHQQ